MKRRAWVWLLLAVAVGLGAWRLTSGDGPRADREARLTSALERGGGDKLLALARAHQGEYVTAADEPRAFAALLDQPLIAVDAREPARLVFAFPADHPETARQLIYCADNRLTLLPEAVLTETEDELRVGQLGINGQGYATARRVRPCWFYCEMYVPT